MQVQHHAARGNNNFADDAADWRHIADVVASLMTGLADRISCHAGVTS